ncbi:dephospho-CoA kinase [Clavibacter michiganensis]|uniref:dephospho-CoA kinase n=1 Tax=Clavibacter michiganensis TaxID=28447 RepID=UPI0013665EBA|nr:dephospho-CoA kinase [Clavibacter michiganensis]MDO4017702.1 dephospho-CoA kinase [Clavibacter michiganensis]MDO4036806.1 dephospho-CoA kinase [Clavibacter michiganensis]MDO4040764.1 dephospho-CoA kinase [Clavibacter michiganensis]MDO4050166.1 dephospho-CoA kinase [Clavibacter michiganensis]MDO4058431.1 dephospho-CoA kinase [Clavibacter michiganensis]
MQVIGLTGGIAAGKTVVADRLAELGAVRIDADRLAREVVEPGTPALAEIARRFGPGVISADGSLDRPALGAVVFQDPDARRDLEAITHPAVRALSAARMAAAAEADADAVVVYDIPLLVESGRVDEFDRIVVVHAPREERIRRLVELRGMSPEEAERRIASQATDEERLAVADEVVDSGISLASTLAQTDRLWANLSDGVGGRS